MQRSVFYWTSFLRSRIIFITFCICISTVPAYAQKTKSEPTPSPTPDSLLKTVPVAPITEQTLKDQKKKDKDDIISVNTDMVSITITVFDSYDSFVPNLKKENFEIYEIYKDEKGKEKKVKQEIAEIADYDMPIGLGVLFDYSGSMEGDKVVKAKEALGYFLERCNYEDSIFLIGFDKEAHLLQDLTTNSRNKIDAIADKLMFTKTKGQTALYDAIYLGIEKVKEAESQHGKHKLALVIFSDGQDNNSRYTESELLRSIKESGVIIYTIGIPPPPNVDQNDPLVWQGVDFLTKIAEMTGGKAHFPIFPNSLRLDRDRNPKTLEQTFDNIALELRHQYSIGYYPVDRTKNGKWRKIKVKVIPPAGYPKLFTRATKNGYYTPKG